MTASTICFWDLLPQVIFDEILIMVGDIDVCGYAAAISKAHSPSDMVFKFYCYYLFPKQIDRPKFDVSKWGSWRSMAINRPRLRLNGFYSLRFVFTKAHCNDAFWEEKSYQSIEVEYYRHIRFLERGELLYCLDIKPPKTIIPFLYKKESQKVENLTIYLGRYSIHKNEISITIPMPHERIMVFKVLLSDNDEEYAGKHNVLQLMEHYSIESPSQLNENQFVVRYPIHISNRFKFHRYWNWK